MERNAEKHETAVEPRSMVDKRILCSTLVTLRLSPAQNGALALSVTPVHSLDHSLASLETAQPRDMHLRPRKDLLQLNTSQKPSSLGRRQTTMKMFSPWATICVMNSLNRGQSRNLSRRKRP